MREERELVTAAAAGDREAFGTLSEGSRPWLRGLCLRLVHDPVAAEDLVQETLLLALRDLGQLRDFGSFRGWLSRIATNCCRAHLRRLLSAPEQALEDEPAEPAPPSEPPLRVDQALARLSPDSRRLLHLFYGEGLSHGEAGLVLSVSAPAVKSRLHRARVVLRKEMLAMLTDEERTRLGVSDDVPWELRTALLVEPEASLREPLTHALESAGYEVISLPTGEAAISAVRERRGHCLLLDKHCVEPHWLEVMALVRADPWGARNVPICVFIDWHPAGSDSDRDVFLAWSAGAAICLTRPFRVQEVVHYVQQLRVEWPVQRDSLASADEREDACPGGCL